ncbi:MAG: Rrf2 family transcriptional regulator [Phycisphaeraceae bacterium]|nr:MAG: Rrf2 family transcriptional regulator [Phycisphaeraceae bacterium]
MLSQSAGYAATALGQVAAAGGRPILVKEIAEACDIPGSYLAKVIQVLARKGIVTTQRGIGGGVTLSRSPTEITLYDLCVALDDPCVANRCMLGVAPCSDERACPAHKFWSGHRERWNTYLKATTLADIAAFELRRRLKPAQPGPASATLTVGGGPAKPIDPRPSP